MRRLLLVALCALALPACGDGDAGSPSDATAAEWRTLAPSTLARTEVAAARVGRYVYVVGGFERDSGATTAATERYDIVRDRWSRVADMPVGLNHAAAVAYRGRVYVLGGYRGVSGLNDETAAMYRYDPATDRWRRSTPLPAPNHAFGDPLIPVIACS